MLWVIVIVAIRRRPRRSWSSRCTTGSSGCATAPRTRWSQVDVQLKRRYDLIPNLVESVKGYAAHEQTTFEDVTKARTAAQQAQGIAEQAQAENMLTAAIGRLFAVAEAYPQLRATENFQQLQAQLADVEQNDRRLAPGLQRHRPDVRQRARDRAHEHRRRPLQLQPAGLLRDGRRHAGGAGRAVLAPEPTRLSRRRARRGSRVLWPAARRRASRIRFPAANVAVQVQPDGSLRVQEQITFDFSGPFSGAYRDIPLRSGESIDQVVGQRGEDVRTGRVPIPSSAASGSPDSFGVTEIRRHVRIVWHYRANNEQRTFTISYRFRGLAVAYDDVVDVNLRVWGDHWPAGLGNLTAAMQLPRAAALSPSLPGLGQPGLGARGRQARPQLAFLQAVEIPAHQFVELRVVFPRASAHVDGGRAGSPGQRAPANRRRGGRLPARLRAATATESTTRSATSAERSCSCSLLGLGPAARADGLRLARLRAGAEDGLRPRVRAGSRPPTPSRRSCPRSCARTAQPGSNEFTATLFDLIRRGRFKSTAVTTERKVWGGLRHEDVADLQVTVGDATLPLTDFEEPVAEVVDSVLAGRGRAALASSGTRSRVTARATASGSRAFKTKVSSAIDARGWFARGGRLGCSRLGIVVVRRSPRSSCSGSALHGFRSAAPRWSDVVMVALGICAGANAASLVFGVIEDAALAPPDDGGPDRGRALGGVPPLPDGLPAAPGGTAGDARALGAVPRLRDRVRDRGARAPGRASAHAGGAARPELALLDHSDRRPRVGPVRTRDRRPLLGLRLGARTAGLAPAASAAASRAAAEAAEAVAGAGPGEVAVRGARRPRCTVGADGVRRRRRAQQEPVRLQIERRCARTSVGGRGRSATHRRSRISSRRARGSWTRSSRRSSTRSTS